MSDEELTDFERRRKLLEGIVSAPDEFVEKMYADYGKSLVSSAGGALGAAAGVAVGGPVGGILGGVVGKRTAGKLITEEGPFISTQGPSAVGTYPHLHRVGGLIFVSGIGPRKPITNEIPGGPIKDEEGNPLDYDIKAQTRSVIDNIGIILEEYGSSLEKVVDVYSMLVDMDRDFVGYNEVYAEYFSEIMPSRTTCAVLSLPTPIAVELKVIAKA
jgi:2-aminomuconate deaminase